MIIFIGKEEEMKRKVCFMFINGVYAKAPERKVLDMGQGEMIVVGVGSYDMACDEASKLADEGVIMIELCGGFGTMGHAKVTEAVKYRCKVGVVRFDNHPGYDNLSGDQKWK